MQTPPPVPPPVPGPHSDKAHEAAKKAQEIGKQAYEEAKAATATAGKAFLTLLADPVTGQSAALSSLGAKGALQAAAVFLSLFIVAAGLGALAGAGAFVGMLGGFGGELRMRVVLSALLGALLTAAAFCLSIWTAARFFGERKLSWADTLFTTGVCLAPLTAAALLGLVLVPLKLLTALMGLYLVAFTLLVLLLNASLTSVAGISPRLGFALTPAVLLVAAVLVSLVS